MTLPELWNLRDLLTRFIDEEDVLPQEKREAELVRSAIERTLTDHGVEF